MKPKIVATAAAIAILLGLVGFLGWRVLQPKIRTATLAEINAVTPPELQLDAPADSAARNRFTSITDLTNHADLKPYTALADPKRATPQKILDQALKFTAAQTSTINQITAILDAGRLQQPSSQPTMSSFPSAAGTRLFEKCVAETGRAYVTAGNYRAATDLYVFCVRLADALLDCDGPLIQYLTAAADESIALRNIQAAISDPKFPVDECQRLLQAVKPSSLTDNALKKSIVADYHHFLFQFLVDPKKAIDNIAGAMGRSSSREQEDMMGTFEPIETARVLGQVYGEAIANTQKPFSEISSVQETLAETAAKGLPELAGDNPGAWDKWKYKVRMNTGYNTIGRGLIQNGSAADRQIFVVSCRMRAFRDAVRIHLAARIYAASHGGSLPASELEFVPILGAWPKDPFNGKSMLYDRTKAVAYSVGENLVDDHGDVKVIVSEGNDVGVSLGR